MFTCRKRDSERVQLDRIRTIPNWLAQTWATFGERDAIQLFEGLDFPFVAMDPERPRPLVYASPDVERIQGLCRAKMLECTVDDSRKKLAIYQNLSEVDRLVRGNEKRFRFNFEIIHQKNRRREAHTAFCKRLQNSDGSNLIFQLAVSHRSSAIDFKIVRTWIPALAELPNHPLASTLTPRESEVLSLIGLGEKPSLIPQRLGISVHTFRDYRKSISKKLNCTGTADLTRKAIEFGLA